MKSLESKIDRFKSESRENRLPEIRRFRSKATIVCYLYARYDSYLGEFSCLRWSSCAPWCTRIVEIDIRMLPPPCVLLEILVDGTTGIRQDPHGRGPIFIWLIVRAKWFLFAYTISLICRPPGLERSRDQASVSCSSYPKSKLKDRILFRSEHTLYKIPWKNCSYRVLWKIQIVTRSSKECASFSSMILTLKVTIFINESF